MLLLLTNFLFVGNSYSQKFKKLEHYYATYQYELAQKAILEIDSAKLSLANKAKFFLLSGKIYSKLNRADLSNQQFLKSKDYYNKLDSIDKAQEINLELQAWSAHKQITLIIPNTILTPICNMLQKQKTHII